MTSLGKLLLADDEPTFQEATADLLRRAGYEVDCVSTGTEAAEALRRTDYDLLVADIRMPGNPDLELVRSIAASESPVPVILVTGNPAMNTAIEAVGLSVLAYLRKPIEIEELLVQISRGVHRRRLERTLAQEQKRLAVVQQRIAELRAASHGADDNTTHAGFDAFLSLVFTNLLDCLSDLRGLTQSAIQHHPPGASENLCHLWNCTRHSRTLELLGDTVRTLELTKRSFRSKELGDLRTRLEDYLSEEKRSVGFRAP